MVVVYSGDIDASKDAILAKVHVRVLALRGVCITHITRHPPPGPVQYQVRSVLAALCIPAIALSRRGLHLAPFHSLGTKSWINVPRLGGHVQAHS